jgi:ELWxxDGT repeat protein/VCBS repeat-containing protein
VLVKDINSGTVSSTPVNIVAFNGAAYFAATTAAQGTELWMSDGTTLGTTLVKDVNSGSASGAVTLLTVAGSQLYFRATEPVAGIEPWVTDGTTGGTHLVADIRVGSNSNPSTFIASNGLAFFTATNVNGCCAETRLYKTDGTTAGTVLLGDTSTSAGSVASQPVDVNGTVFYRALASADPNFLDVELWKSDGTTAGTVLVKDVNPGAAGSNVANLTNVNGTLFFSGGDAAVGSELWKSDGTAAGTAIVADIIPGTNSGSPANLANVNGTLFFSATDGSTGTAKGVELWRTAVNDSPVAVDDSYSTAEDTPLAPAVPGVLTNDTDANGNALTAALVAGPAHGGLTLNADGSFSYSPAANYHGPDSFTYKARDGIIGPSGPVQSDTAATVSITVTSVNDGGPVAVNDSGTTAEDTPLVVSAPGLLSNDTDVDNDPLTATKVTDPANGSVVVNANGSYTYTPNANFNGSDSFTYTANDGTVDSNVATVNITVNPVNDVPMAVDDSTSTAEDTPVTVNAPGVLGNDTDADGDALTAGSASTPANGSVVLNADGSFTYTPNANYNGNDSFTYTANDGTSASNVATVNVTVGAVADAPVAVADTYGPIAANSTLTVPAGSGVLVNDTDAENDALTAGSATQPTNGTVSLAADGSFTYTPNFGFGGADTFTYKANDGSADSAPATVTVNVTAPSGPTTFTIGDVSLNEGNGPGATTATFTILRNGTNSGTSTVKYKTVNVTADGTDYTPIALTPLTFGPGEATKTVTVSINGDTWFEKNETFKVVLSAPKGATLADGTGIATIVNDDPTALLGVNDVSVAEGNAGTTNATFTVTRSGNTSGPASVKVRTTNGTATATSGDYTAVPLTTVNFIDGQSTATVNVAVNGDITVEKNETFKLALSAPVGANIADAAGLGTITNDD